MPRRQKTQADRNRERAAEEREVWNYFYSCLKTLQTLPEALQLVGEAVPSDNPGRKYYSNLGFFLRTFTPPDGANYSEISCYIQFIPHLVRAETIKAEDGEKIIQTLRDALAEKPRL
jgi:hypothetical protein